MKITNRFTGKTMYQTRSRKTLVEYLEELIKKNSNLNNADLRKANLNGVNLYRANLCGVDLGGAYLYGANLRGAYLRGAYLYRANLRGANLYGAYLSGVDLSGANLYGANLSGANLRGANLHGTDLNGASLSEATLDGADLNVGIPPVNSKMFISEILLRAAKSEKELDFAGRVRIQTNCKYEWNYFIDLARKKKVLKWAKDVLFRWKEFQREIENK